MKIRSVIVEFCVVGRQHGAFLCQSSNCYLRPQHIHSTVRYSANEHRHGRNQRDTAVYMTGRLSEKIFGSQVRSTMLGNCDTK